MACKSYLRRVNLPELPAIPEFSDAQKRGLGLIAGLALVLGVLFIFLARGSASAMPVVQPSITLKPTDTFEISTPSPKPSIVSMIVVDVAGKVKNPGVYSLPEGSRAIDAIKAAGNQKPGVDLTDINLAHILMDGEQIVVGQPPAAVVSTTRSRSKSPSPPTPSTVVNLNTATIAQLESLPGIGPVMAGRILAYRQKNGRFSSINDLRKVSGMGKAKFAQIKDLVRL